jgi:hypothetical protein
MRIRSTKPEFWRSRTIASVDWDARLVLKGLESYVDDNGVGKDDIELIVSDLFPRDLAREHSRTLARVTEAVGSLHRAGLIWRYEADGTGYLYISNWDQLQRVDKPLKGRLPRPDGTWDYKESVIRESSGEVPEASRTFAPVTEEQGNSGTGEQAPRKRAAHTIPDDWQPKGHHLSKAKELGVDVTRAAETFRNHAGATDRRLVDWDKGFTNWLLKEKPSNVTPLPTARRTPEQILDGWMYR